MGGRVVTKGRLLRAVWGAAYGGEDALPPRPRRALRRKLDAADPARKAGARIVALPGVGYRVPVPEEDVPDLSAS